MPVFKNPIAVAVLVALPRLASAADVPAKVPGFDPTAIDRSMPACTNFYQFACGSWMARNPVPPDRARWGRFDELAERNQTALRGILEKVSASDPKREAIDEKIGDQYAACMDEAAIEAKGIAALKPELARASLERVKRRDPVNIYHKMKVADLQALTPAFEWKSYLAAAGGPPFTDLNVTVPDFFKALSGQIESAPLDTWKAYLRWHLVHENANLLPAAFVDEDFGFYGKVLTGAKELRPRWKRCVALVDSEMGEALG